LRSINEVTLMGNVSWNPKLYHATDKNRPVCSFGLATNRNWTTDSGEKHEETEFHRIVAFGKLAEICHKYLRKGRRVLVEGRIHSHDWTDNEGIPRTEFEIYIDEMEMLDSQHHTESGKEETNKPVDVAQSATNHQENQQQTTVS
jgi:single-strand DNA-binding protein